MRRWVPCPGDRGWPRSQHMLLTYHRRGPLRRVDNRSCFVGARLHSLAQACSMDNFAELVPKCLQGMIIVLGSGVTEAEAQHHQGDLRPRTLLGDKEPLNSRPVVDSGRLALEVRDR